MGCAAPPAQAAGHAAATKSASEARDTGAMMDLRQAGSQACTVPRRGRCARIGRGCLACHGPVSAGSRGRRHLRPLRVAAGQAAEGRQNAKALSHACARRARPRAYSPLASWHGGDGGGRIRIALGEASAGLVSARWATDCPSSPPFMKSTSFYTFIIGIIRYCEAASKARRAQGRPSPATLERYMSGFQDARRARHAPDDWRDAASVR